MFDVKLLDWKFFFFFLKGRKKKSLDNLPPKAHQKPLGQYEYKKARTTIDH